MNIACEWLKKALSDLKVADLLLKEGFQDESAFHSQQAAEKALKALLISYGVKPLKTHSLERLLSLLEDKIDVSWAYEEDVPALTYYSVEVRYPAPPVSEEEAEEALRIARRVVEWVKDKLRELGIEC